MRLPQLVSIAACVAAATFALTAVAGDSEDAVGLSVEQVTLDNGFHALLHEDHSSPTVVVYMWYGVGSKDEVTGKTGFAHLFEHLMFKGSKHVDDGQFDLLLEGAGGWNNGTTSADRTNYFEQVPANFLELALYLEADRMAGLWDAMNQTVLDNQRDVVKNERRQRVDNEPYGIADLTIQQTLWPEGHGNHNLTIGTMEDLTAASLADVEAFYRSYYVPRNARLVIAGDIDVEATKKLIDTYFGWMPDRPEPSHVTLTEPVTPRAEAALLTATDQVQVPRVSFTWRSPAPFASDDAELSVAAQVLAGGKTSRLYRRLVFDERLASSVSAYQYPQVLGGEFQITAYAREGVDPTLIVDAILEEVESLRNAAPTDDELLRAKRVMEAYLLQSLESLVARADRLAEYTAYTGSPDYLSKELDAYRAVTADGVRRAAKEWLSPSSRVQMVVTPKESEGGAK
jgi:zinc protease